MKICVTLLKNLDLFIDMEKIQKKVKLKNFVNITSGFAFKSNNFNSYGDGMPLIRIRDVNKGYSNTYYLGSYDNQYVVDKGDFLVTMDGNFIINKWKGEKALLNQRVCKIDVKSSDVYPGYFYYFMPEVLTKIQNKTSFVTVKHLSVKDINNIEIPLPPLPIQKKIADALDKADEIRRKRQEAIEKLDELVQSVFLDMFGDPVKNEKGWESTTLSQVCLKITDGTHHSPSTTAEGVPYVTAKHIKPYHVSFESDPSYISIEDHTSIYERCNPEYGDVLYIKDGATTGIAAKNTFTQEISLLSSVALLKPNPELVTSDFIVYWLNHSIVKQTLIDINMAGAAIRRYTLAKIRNFPILLPPVGLQTKFSERANKILKQRELYTAQELQNSLLFNSLMQKAFKGELDFN